MTSTPISPTASQDGPLTLRQHLRAVLTLGLPLIGGHLAQFLIGFTDTAMLGRYSVEALAGQALGQGLWFILFIFGSGFAWALMPLVAQAVTSDDNTRIRRVTRMTLWLSIGFALLVQPIFLFAEPLLEALGQPAEPARLGQHYLWLAGPAILPALIVMLMKSYLSALEYTRVILWITLAGVVVNAGANWLFIFGHLGMPELGVVGAGLATLSVNIFMALAALAYALRVLPEHALLTRFWRADPEALREVFRLGLPIGLTALAEVGLFVASSLMMGLLGTLSLAAHSIALQISSATFMIHIGFSNVATIRAGNALGREDAERLWRGALVVMGCSLVVVAVTVLAFLTIPEILFSPFLDHKDPAVAQITAIGARLLVAAALFQLVDAAQVIGVGLLRGMQDTRVPMIIAMISYWIVGLGTAWALGFWVGLGGVGIWLGLALGLGVAAVGMWLRFIRLRNQRAIDWAT